MNNFLDANKVLNENQAGYRKKYSTTDHVFVIKTLIDLYLSNKKKLYCAFVDFEKAFDTIWRVGLWEKLIKSNVKGIFLRLIHNLYSNIKSCVSVNGKQSDYFGCFTGVRQGECLSPLLFSIYINDMDKYFLNNECSFLKHPDLLENAINLLLLLYADDTVIFADDPQTLQKSLHCLEIYCNKWKLKVNVAKTKVMIFGKRQYNGDATFIFKGNNLEIVNEFKYLGTIF